MKAGKIQILRRSKRLIRGKKKSQMLYKQLSNATGTSDKVFNFLTGRESELDVVQWKDRSIDLEDNIFY